MNKNPYADLERAINNKFRYEELTALATKKGRGYVRLKDHELVFVAEYQDTVECHFGEFRVQSAYGRWSNVVYAARYGHAITTKTNPSRTITLSDIREFIWEDL